MWGLRELLQADTVEDPQRAKTGTPEKKAERPTMTRPSEEAVAETVRTQLRSHLSHPCEGLVVTAETEVAEEAQHLVRSVFGTLNLQMADFRAPAETEPTASSWSITEEAIFWHIKVQSSKTV